MITRQTIQCQAISRARKWGGGQCPNETNGSMFVNNRLTPLCKAHKGVYVRNGSIETIHTKGESDDT